MLFDYCIIMISYIFVAIFGASSISGQFLDLPVGSPRCKRTDPNLNQCLLEASESIKPFLVAGIPYLGVPSIEPLRISEIALEQGSRAVNVKATIKNVLVHGLSSYKFSKFDCDMPSLQWFSKLTIKLIKLDGDYSVNGKILLAPIVGSGKFIATLDTADIDAYQKYEFYEKDGARFMRPVQLNTSLAVTKPKVQMDGLFDGNQDLAKVANAAINDNINVLFEELRPAIEKIVTDLLQDIMFKNFADHIPFDKLYPA